MTRNGEKDQAEGIRGKQAQASNHVDADSIGKTRRISQHDGGKSQRSDGKAFASDTEWGKTVIGKILSQLRELREAHLAYVNAHSDRLRARLAEDDEHRSKIITDMDALEQQLLQIQVKQKSPATSDE